MDYPRYGNELAAKESDEEQEEEEKESQFRLVNVIFLPFHPVVRAVVLLGVLLKCLLAPSTLTFPSLQCSSALPPALKHTLTIFYNIDFLFGVDVLLHLVHRQMADEATKREFAPKSASGLVLDIVAMIPILGLLLSDLCPKTQLWPNILGFTEIACFYRIIEYFDLKDTHSYVKLFIGYIIVYIILINCFTCLFLLLTYNGLCSACYNNTYDWRIYLLQRFPYLNDGYNTYLFAYEYVGSYILNFSVDDFEPATYLEYFIVLCLIIISFALRIYVLGPKLFCEEVFRKKRITIFHTRAKRMLEQTENSSANELEVFYSFVWTKKKGITSTPTIMARLPWYIRLQMEQDIVWPVFFHSPTLRNTSSSYRRWICDFLQLKHKIPGERFFSGPHCFTHLYYLLSGTVQFVSSDDGITPVLSVSDGTILGDISFYLPPLQRKTIVRCLTYCEIIIVPRSIILLSMNKFPKDRTLIIKSARNRIDHAKRLYACKTKTRGADRVADEGLKWLKVRWWQIFKVLETWKNCSKKDSTKCNLPSERTPYHCAKYIGQLVLCQANELRLKAIFCRVKFPWLLVEHSSFTDIWNQIVIYTVYVVALTYPPNLARPTLPMWFLFIQCIVNLIFGADVIFSLLVSTDNLRHNTSIKTILVKKLKSFQFILDVVSAVPIEVLTVILEAPKLYEISQFNRLLKIHRVISYKSSHWEKDRDPLNAQLLESFVAPIMFLYISAYCCYLSPRVLSSLKNIQFWFGPRVCLKDLDPKCKQDENGMLWVFYYYVFEYFVGTSGPSDMLEVMLFFLTSCLLFFFKSYINSKILSIWYLKYNEIGNFNTLTSSLTGLYAEVGVSGETLRRVERFFLCQWRWRRGAGLGGSGHTREPPGAAWRAHGAAAERVIAASAAFASASRPFVAELAKRAVFTVLPHGFVLEQFGTYSEHVTWIIRGALKCEYENEEGELVSYFESPKEVLSISALLPGVLSLKTYETATDCEVLSITVKDFSVILKRFPEEWKHISSCVSQMKPLFEELFLKCLKQHQIYQKKVQERILEKHQSAVSEEPAADSVEPDEELELSPPTSFPFRIYIDHPETPFVRFWMLLRAFTVLLQLFTLAVRVFLAHVYWNEIVHIVWFCNVAGFFDIIINFVLPYYDSRGVAVRSRALCARRYLARGFWLDALGTLPIITTLRIVAVNFSLSFHDLILISNVCKCAAPLYKLTGYLNYLVDVPTRYRNHLLLLKWQILTILLGLTVTNIFFRNCIELMFNERDQIEGSELRNTTCWSYFLIYTNTTTKTYKLYRPATIFTLDLTQGAMLGFNLNHYRMYDAEVWMTWLVYILAFFMFGLISTYCQALLMITTKGDSQFRERLDQLLRFLREERVELSTVHRCLTYYNYHWIRFKGIDTVSMHKNIAEVSGLKRDVQYLLFKANFEALNTGLDGGEMLERRLAALMQFRYVPPGEQLAREQQLAPRVCLLCSGAVAVSRRGRRLATLTQGCLFGQLSGAAPRPLRITARTETHVDILEMPFKHFLEILSEESKMNLYSTPGYRFDFIKLKKAVEERAEISTEYLLSREGTKVIKLPLMGAPVSARESLRYSRLLFAEWFWNTTLVLALTVLTWTLYDENFYAYFLCIVSTIDFFHFMFYISEFFTMNLTIVNNKCVYRYIGWRRIYDVFFYVDTVSIIMPIVGLIFGIYFHSFRVLRIYSYIHFHKYFCKDFRHPLAPLMLRVAALALLLLALSAHWVSVGCNTYKPYYFSIPNDIPKFINDTIDQNEWKIVTYYRDKGCIRNTPTYNSSDGKEKFVYVVAKQWYGTYLSGILFIFALLTGTRIVLFQGFSATRTQHKLILGILTYWGRLWITAHTISYFYTLSHELYLFSHKVESLRIYFKSYGVSENLLKTLNHYFNKLWRKHKGSAIPEFATQAPLCLKEDIFSSLYMHHFTNLPLFSVFPDYFLRQLVVRVQRKTVFPGNLIVQEGDINPTMYFIHEGEVERWATDAKGESKMASVLTMNSHFGVLCGAIRNFPYQYSYYSRTVVDLILLHYDDWQDLLDAYPELKKKFGIACLQGRHVIKKTRANAVNDERGSKQSLVE